MRCENTDATQATAAIARQIVRDFIDTDQRTHRQERVSPSQICFLFV